MERQTKFDASDGYWIAAVLVMAIVLVVGLVMYFKMTVRLDGQRKTAPATQERRHASVWHQTAPQQAHYTRQNNTHWV